VIFCKFFEHFPSFDGKNSLEWDDFRRKKRFFTPEKHCKINIFREISKNLKLVLARKRKMLRIRAPHRASRWAFLPKRCAT
jgi:hypothetical protein